jgi:Carbohydrate binding domain
LDFEDFAGETLKISALSVGLLLALFPLRTSGAENQTQPQLKASKQLPNRWVFCFGYGRRSSNIPLIKEIVDTSSKTGLNGIILSSWGFDSITRWSRKDLELLRQVQAFCAAGQIELIPTGFSAGYGGGALGYNRSFSAALPVTVNLIVRKNRVIPVAGKNLFLNGNLEQYKRNRFSNFRFHDNPGNISFVDQKVFGSGKTSIRFENFGSGKHGHGRIMQEVKVQPGKSYRFSLKVKTRELKPASAFKLLVLADGKTVASLQPGLKSTGDWTEIELEILDAKKAQLKFYAGVWGGKSGAFWLDDFQLRETASLNDIVRRSGTPLELSSSDGKTRYIEGVDFEKVKNLRQLPFLELTKDTSIPDRQKLQLSCYRMPYVTHSWGRQHSLCMSNPELYKYWEAQARRICAITKCKRILLAMDEIRNGGGCQLCKKSGKSMARILGECITRQRQIFKKINPKIEVLIWSDMLDPHHNAGNNYYGVVGDFTDSWKHVPRDLTIVCWQHKIRRKSLDFFSGKGFATIGAAYYDARDLTGCRQWLESLQKTPRARGIIYTSWQKKYQLLGAFGQLLKNH